MIPIIIAFITGAVTSVIGYILNYKLSTKAGEKKHRKLLEKSIINQEYQKQKTYYETINAELLKIYFHLSCIETELSTNSIVIDASSKMTATQFDEKYKNHLVHFHTIKASVQTYFPSLTPCINKIDGTFNTYWGHQRILISINAELAPKSYSEQLQEVLKLTKNARCVINDFKDRINYLKPTLV